MTQKTVQEIQNLIAESKKNLETSQEKVRALRQERASLVIEDNAGNNPKIDSIDREIISLSNAIDNLPIELDMLSEKLVAENQRLAQVERDDLLEKQQEVANEVELLSKGLVALLSKAVDVNNQLIPALSAEASMREKTGLVILESYCHGSRESLMMLLETCQAQMQGQHTAVVGAGMVGSNRRIQL